MKNHTGTLRIALATLGIGCFSPAPDGGDPTGGPGDGRPATCVEDHRVEVTDLSVPAEGFEAAPAELLALVEGSFEGATELEDGSTMAITLEVVRAADLPVVAVTGHVEGGTDPAMGEPDVPCAARYEFVVDSLLEEPAGNLSAAARSTVAAMGADFVSFTASTPLAEVGGDRAPASIVPDEWDEVVLSQAFSSGGDGPWLSLLWSASRDAQAAAQPVQDTGGVSTTTIEPSGMAELLGAFPLRRSHWDQ